MKRRKKWREDKERELADRYKKFDDFISGVSANKKAPSTLV